MGAKVKKLTEVRLHLATIFGKYLAKYRFLLVSYYSALYINEWSSIHGRLSHRMVKFSVQFNFIHVMIVVEVLETKTLEAVG